MSNVISVRRDSEVDAILTQLGDAYGNPTDTVKTALRELLAARRRADLHAEAARLASDPNDRAEIAAVHQQLDSVRAW